MYRKTSNLGSLDFTGGGRRADRRCFRSVRSPVRLAAAECLRQSRLQHPTQHEEQHQQRRPLDERGRGGRDARSGKAEAPSSLPSVKPLPEKWAIFTVDKHALNQKLAAWVGLDEC